jgi:hypothetical protein
VDVDFVAVSGVAVCGVAGVADVADVADVAGVAGVAGVAVAGVAAVCGVVGGSITWVVARATPRKFFHGRVVRFQRGIRRLCARPQRLARRRKWYG